MSRNTKTITLPGVRNAEVAGERDNGKTFMLTEMSARQAERWANRVFLAVAHSGLDLPPDTDLSGGMAGIRQLALLTGHLRFPDLEPLMDELLGCVRFVGDPRQPMLARALINDGGESDDIEDVTTLHLLRSEVIGLHVNFLLAARIFNLIAVASTMTEFSFENAPTSPPRSRRSSRAGLRR